MRDEKPYDVFCYDPLQKQREEKLQKEKEEKEREEQEKERKEQEKTKKERGNEKDSKLQKEMSAVVSTGKIDGATINAKILSLLPNPHGKDTGKEYLQISLNDEAILSDLSISINGRKKMPKWSFVGSGVYESYGSFQLPNRTACVDLFYEKKGLDRLCYIGAKE